MVAPSVLTEEYIARRLAEAYRPGVIASTDLAAPAGTDRTVRCAAVLLPLLRRDDEWHLLLTRRTETVEHHKGQVAFPGGGCDPGESTPEQTALREAMEEIGLAPQDVRVLGRLNDFVAISDYRISPVVGIMPWPYPLQSAPAEVDRVFTIPLPWLAERANWEERSFTPAGLPRPVPVILYHPYDGETLWGISARITHDFLHVLGLEIAPGSGIHAAEVPS